MLAFGPTLPAIIRGDGLDLNSSRAAATPGRPAPRARLRRSGENAPAPLPTRPPRRAGTRAATSRRRGRCIGSARRPDRARKGAPVSSVVCSTTPLYMPMVVSSLPDRCRAARCYAVSTRCRRRVRSRLRSSGGPLCAADPSSGFPVGTGRRSVQVRHGCAAASVSPSHSGPGTSVACGLAAARSRKALRGSWARCQGPSRGAPGKDPRQIGRAHRVGSPCRNNRLFCPCSSSYLLCLVDAGTVRYRLPLPLSPAGRK